MIIIPDNYYTYNIMFIDPGLNNTGVAIFTMDYRGNYVRQINAFTLENEKSNIITGMDTNDYQERFIKLNRLSILIKRVLELYTPYTVVCESPFFNRFRPTAYAALVEVLYVIQSAVFEYNKNIYFSKLEPLLIKKHIGAGMMKGKIDVKQAVMSNNDIMTVLNNDINELDEHAIDAIAIGYTYLSIQGGFYVFHF